MGQEQVSENSKTEESQMKQASRAGPGGRGLKEEERERGRKERRKEGKKEGEGRKEGKKEERKKRKKKEKKKEIKKRKEKEKKKKKKKNEKKKKLTIDNNRTTDPIRTRMKRNSIKTIILTTREKSSTHIILVRKLTTIIRNRKSSLHISRVGQRINLPNSLVIRDKHIIGKRVAEKQTSWL